MQPCRYFRIKGLDNFLYKEYITGERCQSFDQYFSVDSVQTPKQFKWIIVFVGIEISGS